MADKKRAMKVSHIERKYQKKMEMDNFGEYVSRYTDKRLFLRLVLGKAIKPCGRDRKSVV